MRLSARADAGLVANTVAAVYESAPLELAFAATHAGLQWIAGGPSGTELRFAVRTSGDGHEWAPWTAGPAAGGPAGAGGAPRHTAAASGAPGGVPRRAGTV